jgi:GYF domain 2
MTYHLWLEEQAKGPFTLGQLRAMWNSGQITSETRCTSDAGESWFDLSELLDDLEPATVNVAPQVMPAIEVPAVKPDKYYGLKLVLIVLLTVGVCLGGYLVLFKGSTIAFTKSSAPLDTVIPVEIKVALNNLRSATETGVKLDDYSSFVIALKTADATYGNSLTPHQQVILLGIVLDYDTSLQIWKVADMVNDDSAMPADSPFLAWFQKLKIEPIEDTQGEAIVKVESHDGDPHIRIFKTKDLLGKAWSAIDQEVDEFLAANQ